MVATIGEKEGELDEKALGQLADPGLYIGLRGWKYRESKKINRLVDHLDKLGRSFHVLSYCSPKRNGRHKVQIEVSRDAGPHGRRRGRRADRGGARRHRLRPGLRR